jgi:hypothetical protein
MGPAIPLLLAGALAAPVPPCGPEATCAPAHAGVVQRAAAPAQPALAVIAFLAFDGYGDRTRHREAAEGGRHGVSRGIGGGLALRARLGTGRAAIRVLAAASRVEPILRTQESILLGKPPYWLTRAEAGLELRVRPGVPGYFVIAADALHNPEGFLLAQQTGDIRPVGVDSGVYPRLGIGAGLDLGRGPTRLRIEGIYRLGRYNEPAAAEAGLLTPLTTRDFGVSLGAVRRVR